MGGVSEKAINVAKTLKDDGIVISTIGFGSFVRDDVLEVRFPTVLIL